MYIYIYLYIYVYIYVYTYVYTYISQGYMPSRRRPHSRHAGAGTDAAGAGILRSVGRSQVPAAGQRRLSAGAQLGREGRQRWPEERRRRVEGHHHAGLRAWVGFPERLNGAARVGARKTRAQLRTLTRRVATPCIGHTTTAVTVKQISGTSMGISPSCVFEMEQHAARIECLLDQEVLDRVEVARTS